MSVSSESHWLGARPGGVGVLVTWSARDGSPRIASSGTDGAIHIWDPEQGRAVGDPLIGHTAAVWVLTVWRWSGGLMLVSTGEDGTIRTWDPESGQPYFPTMCGHEGWVRALALWNDPDGAPRLASAGTDDAVLIWDPVLGTTIGEPLITGHERLASLASWSTPGGTRLAVAGDDGMIRIWDPLARTEVEGTPLKHSQGLWILVPWTAPDGGPRLAAAGSDGTIRVWNPETRTSIAGPLRGHTGWVPALVVWTAADGGTRLVSASTDGTIRTWDPETGALIGEPLTEYSGSQPTLTAWTAPNGRGRFSFVGENGAIRTSDAQTGELVGKPLIGHTAGRWALTTWIENGARRLAASGDDGIIRVWDVATGRAVGEPLVGHTAGVWGLVTWSTPDGVRLASTGDDGTVLVWDMRRGTTVHPPMTGHRGWVPALAGWSRPDGSLALVSGGVDGTVRRWDPGTGRAIGEPLTGHTGWVMTVATWTENGDRRLASGGVDGTIRIRDADTGESTGEPLIGHDGWVRALVPWTSADGRQLLISGSFDGTIRMWNPATGRTVGAPLTGHSGRVAALTTWRTPDGGARLASTGEDGSIHLWNLDTGTSTGPPLTGHEGGVWALISWTDADSGVLLASAGHDGTVRLWDPQRRIAVRTIEVGPVAMSGVSDAPTSHDVIGRQGLANAIADQLVRPQHAGPDDAGPTVVSIEGPWGCGKSTLMNLIRRRLPVPSAPENPPDAAGQLTVRQVLKQIRQYTDDDAPDGKPAVPVNGVVTAWFNPWVHQSGEQVWAGLASEIVETASTVLYPTEPERERYWLTRNLGRIDRHALALALRRRTRSPILGLAIAVVLAPAVIALVETQPSGRRWLELVSSFVVLVIAVAVLLLGVAHTYGRRIWGKAIHYLPSELFRGPLTDGLTLGAADGEHIQSSDPLRSATAGSLYLYQHNIDDVVDDLAARGYELVVFVDDVDRCRASTTVEVFEAINLFLSNAASTKGLRARFVVGLDSTVVAGSFDTHYRANGDPSVALHGDDPTPGWAFLRKLVQLPVVVPQIPDDGVERFVDAITRRDAVAAPPPVAGVSAPRRADRVAPPVAVPRQRTPSTPAPAGPPAPGRTRPPVETIPWRAMEHHPEVHAFVVRRLAGQPDRSIREAKRLLNVWQLYARMLDSIEPLHDPRAAIARACDLVLVAEIVTRWPALQRPLHRRIGDRRGLQLLAAAAHDDDAWRSAVALAIGDFDGDQALVNLRRLLSTHDGPAVADLASRLI